MEYILSITESSSPSKISQHVSFKPINFVLVRGGLPTISLMRLIRTILPTCEGIKNFHPLTETPAHSYELVLFCVDVNLILASFFQENKF